MAIENRDLEPGTKLVAKYLKLEYHAEVVAGENGKVLYRLPNGKEYRSTSALGTAITGKACNGWNFWSVDTGETTVTETATPTEVGTPTNETEEPTYTPLEEEIPAEPTTASFRRVANQRGVDEGQVRLYCDACHNSFIVPQSKNPTECPIGHRPS